MSKPKQGLEKVTLNLKAGDKDILTRFYPGAGWSVAARKIISKHCEALLAAQKGGTYGKSADSDE